MLSIAPPREAGYALALMTGLSTIRYPAFTAQPESERVRERLLAQRPELVEAGIHLIVTQLPSGDLIIGDTHTYGDTPTPFRDERLDGLLLAEARRLLGADTLVVRERWIGVYPTTAGAHLATGGDHFIVTAPFEGARVVEVISGISGCNGVDRSSPPRPCSLGLTTNRATERYLTRHGCAAPAVVGQPRLPGRPRIVLDMRPVRRRSYTAAIRWRRVDPAAPGRDNRSRRQHAMKARHPIADSRRRFQRGARRTRAAPSGGSTYNMLRSAVDHATPKHPQGVELCRR